MLPYGVNRPQWVVRINYSVVVLNTLRPGQNGRYFPDDIFKCIFLNENVWIPIKISLKFVPKSAINNILALVQRMAWRRSGDKPLSEPMVVSLLTHLCVTRPQWVDTFKCRSCIYSYSLPNLGHHCVCRYSVSAPVNGFGPYTGIVLRWLTPKM